MHHPETGGRDCKQKAETVYAHLMITRIFSRRIFCFYTLAIYWRSRSRLGCVLPISLQTKYWTVFMGQLGMPMLDLEASEGSKKKIRTGR